ncbi:uL30 family ribosomal protein [Candidatus Woesearchaeota archaeon]|nr:uL30 family ribosomal protein [Candidatus Woesearchaeota archaeon]
MKVAIVRIRGPIRIDRKTEHALTLLGLNKPNHCALREATPALTGTLKLIQPYVTWGEANDDTIKLFDKNHTLPLHPPRKGYGRKGVKIPFAKSGAYGNRKEKINDLIKRMTN